MDDGTIAALSTPPGRGGIAVIRLSGPQTLSVLKLIIESFPENPIPQRVYRRFVVHNGQRLEESLVTFFRNPHSYTGEDLAEISTHSNPFIIEAVLELMFSCGARQALPGEFTQRAFKNGRLDLIQAEAVNELIGANTRYYASMEFGNLEGKLSALISGLRENLVQLGVKVETALEFQEDQFMDAITLSDEIETARQRIGRILSASRFNQVLQRGFKVVIAGKVNVGKSSLFNALLLKERSITSTIPGTTRDYIEENLYINGMPFEITDIAGYNLVSSDHIESEGIRRSLEKIDSSDAVIFMVDASQPLADEDVKIFARINKQTRLIVANKIDRIDHRVISQIKSAFPEDSIHEISVKEGINLEAVSGFLKQLTGILDGMELEMVVNRRQKMQLEILQQALIEIGRLMKSNSPNLEIIAEEIRGAIGAIGELTGKISSEDVINRIFSDFCVGK